eukprot:1702287-Prymnesium_polylepis.1
MSAVRGALPPVSLRGGGDEAAGGGAGARRGVAQPGGRHGRHVDVMQRCAAPGSRNHDWQSQLGRGRGQMSGGQDAPEGH